MNQLLFFADHLEQLFEWLLCIRFLPDGLCQHLGQRGQWRSTLPTATLGRSPVIGWKIISNDRLAFQAISGADPEDPIDLLSHDGLLTRVKLPINKAW